MKKPIARAPLLQHLDELEEMCQNRNPKLEDVFHVFGAEGHYVLILFLILPFLQPIPLFGLSTPFGVLISIVITFAYLKKPPLLPRAWKSKEIPRETVLKIALTAEKMFERLLRFLYPRWTFLFHGVWRHINFGVLLFHALLLMLPLPIPFSNAIPAWVIFLQALSHLEEDGVLLLVSFAGAIGCLAFFIALGNGLQAGFQLLNQVFVFLKTRIIDLWPGRMVVFICPIKYLHLGLLGP